MNNSCGTVVDVANLLSPALGEAGLDPARLEGDLQDRFTEAHASVTERRAAGDMGFFDLPYATESISTVQAVADGFGQWFENMVVLGMGGSALGVRTLRDALLGPLWNDGPGELREHFPRLYVLDNVDPATTESLLRRIDLRRSLFNVVSKSGSTAETMAQYLVVAGRLAEAVGEDAVAGHFLFTTSAKRGDLRVLADRCGIPTLEIPENVGGRFSVLSPVGLLSAAVTGIDLQELAGGAAVMEERCRATGLMDNPAGLLATLLHAAHTERGTGIHVLMPYSDRLRSFSLWFQQLWAESLGKAVHTDGSPAEVGPTPLPAVGASDQHAQLQLFMEGPRDKVVIFLAVADAGVQTPIPALHDDLPAMGYLGGRALGELLAAERDATKEALRQRGRHNLTIEVPRVDARTLGELFMLFEIATVYAGALYGVDPLGQPGVELGKELTYGIMGRKGFAAPDLPTLDPRWRV